MQMLRKYDTISYKYHIGTKKSYEETEYAD